MPRSVGGIFTLVPSYLAVSGQTIRTEQHNPPLEDIAADLNTARPITAGGTGATTAAGARTNLGLDAVQPLNANLTSLSGLTFAANKGLYTTAANTAALFDLTAAGRALLDDADEAAQRTTLGLGTAAVLNTSADSDFAGVAPTSLATRSAINDRFGVANAPGAKTALNATGTAPIYACRARGTFDGTVPSTLGAANLSFSRTATGEFTFTFGTAMPDANYAVTVGLGVAGGGFPAHLVGNKTASGFTLTVNRVDGVTSRQNPAFIDIAVFR